MRTILLPLIVLLLCNDAAGQLVQIKNEHAATRQVCNNGICTLVRDTDYGSGVIVGTDERTTFVLTAAHVIKDKSRSLTAQGKPAIVVSRDDENDIAVLRVHHVWPDGQVIEFGDDLESGEQVQRHGFGTGQARAYESRAVSARYITGTAVNGDSGGGVVDSDHKLRGIITHITDDGQTRLAPVSACRQFVIGCVPHITLRPLIVGLPGQRTRPPHRLLPSPPDEDRAPDVPDIEKTSRIRELERQIAEIQKQLASVQAKSGPPGPPGKDGTNGRDGADGKTGRDLDALPIDVQIVSVSASGVETLIAKESYPRGHPIRLVFREEWIKSGE